MGIFRRSGGGIKIVQYHLSDELVPMIDANEIQQNDWIYIVNYYGQLKREDIIDYRKQYGRIIVDNAQAFFDEPVGDIPTIYSCRKFLGVCDGAYISPYYADVESLPKDKSSRRFGSLLGRLEENARKYYEEMLITNKTFQNMEPMRMSASTQNILRGINYDYIIKKRRENYEILSDLLPSRNPFTLKKPNVPFAYPYYCQDGLKLRSRLAYSNIFIQTNWKYLLEAFEPASKEYEWTANIVPLPIDQRYGYEEMRFIYECVKNSQ